MYRLPWEATVHMSTGLCGSEPYIAPEQFLRKRPSFFLSLFSLPTRLLISFLFYSFLFFPNIGCDMGCNSVRRPTSGYLGSRRGILLSIVPRTPVARRATERCAVRGVFTGVRC